MRILATAGGATRLSIIAAKLSVESKNALYLSMPRHSELLTVSHPAMAREEVAKSRNSILAIDVPSAGTIPTFASWCGEVYEGGKHTPLLAFFQPNKSDAAAVLQLGIFETAELVTLTSSMCSGALRDAIDRCIAATAARTLERLVGFSEPDILVRALRCALRLNPEEMNCAALAKSLNMHERTLRKLFAQHRLPSPQWLLGWTRLLLSAWLLRNISLTVEDAANRLEYASPSTFRGTLKRYLGRTATDIRSGDPAHEVAIAMRAAFAVQ